MDAPDKKPSPFVKELIEQMDGPNPEDVEAELLKNPPTTTACEHCQKPLNKAPDAVEPEKLPTIHEPNDT